MFQMQVAERLVQAKGQAAEIQALRSGNADPMTGNITGTVLTRKLRVVPVTTLTASQIEEDLSYLASNRQYTFGGLFDTTVTLFIGLYRSIQNFDVRLGDAILWNGTRFRITKRVDFADKNTFILTAAAHTESGGVVHNLTVGTHLRIDVDCEVVVDR